MRALITGGHGFVGRHLAQHLVSCRDDVALTYLPETGSDPALVPTPNDTANKVSIPTATQSLALDVTDRDAVFNVISLLKPDVVYHLAALTFVPDAEAHITLAANVNVKGTQNIIDAILEHSPDSRLLYVSSAEVYGAPRPGSLPVKESAEMRPTGVYGLSKSIADLSVFKASYRDNLHAIRVRPFSHVGPGQGEHFAISSFARQIASIKLGKSEPSVSVGNLDVKRDYSDVSDIVRGYREAVLNGKNSEAYNLCSGQSAEIGELLQMLVKLADVDVEIKEDPERVRTVDVPDLCGSYEKAQRDFGWKPRVEREAMLDSLLAYWLEVLD